ncbi:MAG: M23 family metallopeptidase [bacterium]|nr:M23 family metallopeptidase [bacterium]MCP5071227.1 M23 family metallopeptidase [bacterium]
MDRLSDLEQPKLRLFREAMGLAPFRERFAQAMIALRGQEDVPPSKFGLSSLRQLRPSHAIPLWRGRFVVPRRAIVMNLFNHRQTPIESGWSVLKTQAEDFRGRDLTYDSHNGTDFAIPVGTPVLAAASGEIVHVVSEFNRGGLKIFIDHGEGLMTTSAHLARSLVQVGQIVARGEVVALSGYSGLDSLVTFPFGMPHVHFNTWLDGKPVDPFPSPENASLWRAGELPEPTPTDEVPEPFVPSVYAEPAVAELLAGCRTRTAREELERIQPLAKRAARAIVESNYYPTRFTNRPNPYVQAHPRTRRLDLPFHTAAFDGVVFVDEPWIGK